MGGAESGVPRSTRYNGGATIHRLPSLKRRPDGWRELEFSVPPLPWKRYLLAGSIAAAVYMTVPATLAGSLLYGGIALSSVLATIAGIRRYRPPRPWGWRLLAIGLAWLSAGDIAFSLAGSSAAGATIPSAADAFYLIAYPFLVAGLLALMPPGRTMFDLGEATDAAILI
ncbi:MAG TPA: hypothetical protein VFU81_20585, partial [Thermomicrobiales bacterium]|nr:hypothetical protein [Thermomicrobiales bacterium]